MGISLIGKNFHLLFIIYLQREWLNNLKIGTASSPGALCAFNAVMYRGKLQ